MLDGEQYDQIKAVHTTDAGGSCVVRVEGDAACSHCRSGAKRRAGRHVVRWRAVQAAVRFVPEIIRVKLNHRILRLLADC